MLGRGGGRGPAHGVTAAGVDFEQTDHGGWGEEAVGAVEKEAQEADPVREVRQRRPAGLMTGELSALGVAGAIGRPRPMMVDAVLARPLWPHTLAGAPNLAVVMPRGSSR